MQDFLSQLSFEPDIRRPRNEAPAIIVTGGMGGSALAGEALRFLNPERKFLVHHDYDLPWEAPPEALHLAISYSGNTEETLSFAAAAKREGRKLAIVTSGGKLAEFAEREQLPLALVPAGLVPRNAFMYLVRAALAVCGNEEGLTALANVSITEEVLREDADEDAHFLLQSVPLFYTSDRNRLVGHLAKLVVNESSRTPAFTNVFPELNHNEMQSFDTDMPEGLAHLFRFVLVRDTSDHDRVLRRMDAFQGLMEERGRLVRVLDISDLSRADALATLWLRFILVGRHLAATRGIDPDTQPLVDAFKKQL